MMEAPTYICKDCGIAVYDALGVVRKRCLTCQWIAERPEDERDELRFWLDRPPSTLKSTPARSWAGGEGGAA